MATITWSLAAPARPDALAAGLVPEHLEVTTFKDGFARGTFAQLLPVRADQPFGMAPNSPQSVVPSLRGLRATLVTNMEVLAARSDPRAAGVLPPGAANDPSRVVVVEVEGLEPGLNYFWRRTPDGPIARCQAPICPSDGRGR